MTPTFHALWTLCALSTVVFAAALAAPGPRRPRSGAAFVVGAGGVAFAGPALPDAALIGTVAAAAAGLLLWASSGRPGGVLLAGLLAGGVAGSWAALLSLQLVPAPIAAILVLVVAALSVTLTIRRPRFAPDQLREEALLFTLIGGVVVAVLPGVQDGWQAARNLNATAPSEMPALIPAWTLSLVVASLLLGSLSTLWSRR